MNRLQLMELVRARQVGQVSRREFLRQTTAVLGSFAAANTLLAACSAPVSPEPPPVVDESKPVAEPGTSADGAFTTGIVTYPGKEGEELMGYLAAETDAAARPAVIVLQEWWGLNDHIKEVARRFAGAGYVALAPDLYHGVVTTEPDEARKQAMELGMRDAVGEIQQAVAYLRAQPSVTGKVGIVGFCMGGGLVLKTAVSDPSLNAGIVFYGSPLTPGEAAQMQIPILSFIGTADSIPVSGVEAMHAAFDGANVPNAFQVYDGAQHAFFNDTRASYNAEAAADAWERSLAWFGQYLAAS
ncbi:MAG: dienelactone hydrolase family protein [Anaerolineales bacterium]|nr:dienelactone hydrolase family protein [Anaerolineales bacterium]